jgi:hypothetical protein
LSTFPESAYLTTHFGELPLHLAVESGAAPEVVNLIAVANWGAIVASDNSGRVPIDILAQGDLLSIDDNRIVYESLKRCYKAYTDVQKKAQDEKNEIKRKHEGQLTILHRQHQEALQREYETQETLLSDLKAQNSEIARMKKIDAAKDRLLMKAHDETISWKVEIQRFTETISKLHNDLLQEKQNVARLKEALKGRDDDIGRRDEVVQCLSNDLRAIALAYNRDNAKFVRATENAMRAMVSSQVALQKQLSGQANSIESLLSDRVIESIPRSNTSREEKEEFLDHEQPGESGEVASSLVAAAVAALKQAPLTVEVRTGGL